MKVSLVMSITILLFVLVVFFAGCSGSAPSEPSVAGPQATPIATNTAGTPAATTAQQPATTVTISATVDHVKIFNGDYNWVEYRQTNSVTMPPNPRSDWVYSIKTERSGGVYKTTPAVRYKTITKTDYPELVGNTVTVTKNGWIIIDDRYYDPSSDRFLGGTETSTIKGTVQPATDIPAYQNNREDRPSGFLGIMPFGEMNITLTCTGTEPVTVPADTYPDARKCSGSFKDGTPVTFWIVPKVPVPVRYEFPYTYQDGVDPFNSYELIGWG